jgi:hypothetical protein
MKNSKVMAMPTILEEELALIDLHVGDIIVQSSSGVVGLLVEKMNNYQNGFLGKDILGDLWFWRVAWLKNVDRNKDISQGPFLNPILEEEGLKMAIFIGNIEHYSSGKFDEVIDDT